MRYIDTLKYKEEYEPVHQYTFFDDNYQVIVPAKELFAYRQGKLMQIAMPSVSADDREWLMTGLTPDQFDAVFQDNNIAEQFLEDMQDDYMAPDGYYQ
jgi:hypothetical protein